MAAKGLFLTPNELIEILKKKDMKKKKIMAKKQMKIRFQNMKLMNL